MATAAVGGGGGGKSSPPPQKPPKQDNSASKSSNTGGKTDSGSPKSESKSQQPSGKNDSSGKSGQTGKTRSLSNDQKSGQAQGKQQQRAEQKRQHEQKKQEEKKEVQATAEQAQNINRDKPLGQQLKDLQTASNALNNIQPTTKEAQEQKAKLQQQMFQDMDKLRQDMNSRDPGANPKDTLTDKYNRAKADGNTAKVKEIEKQMNAPSSDSGFGKTRSLAQIEKDQANNAVANKSNDKASPPTQKNENNKPSGPATGGEKYDHMTHGQARRARRQAAGVKSINDEIAQNLPGQDQLNGKSKANDPNSTQYRTRQGDTYWNIAKAMTNKYGLDKSKFGDIQKALQNQVGQDPRSLQPGQNINVKDIVSRFGGQDPGTQAGKNEAGNQNRPDGMTKPGTETKPNSPDKPSGTDRPQQNQQPQQREPQGVSKFGDRLARNAERVARAMGTKGKCAKGVRRALQGSGVKYSAVPSAYQAAKQLSRLKDQFQEVKYDPNKIQRGDVIVHGRSRRKPHGHIAVALGNGKEASDHVGGLIRNRGQYGKTRVFRPIDPGGSQVASRPPEQRSGTTRPEDRTNTVPHQGTADSGKQSYAFNELNQIPLNIKPSAANNWGVPKNTPKFGASKVTGYYPANTAMQGGFKDRMGGQLRGYTLNEFLAGKAPYVKVAIPGKSWLNGQRLPRGGAVLMSPELNKKYGRVIPLVATDTGSSKEQYFPHGELTRSDRGAVDIATANRSTAYNDIGKRRGWNFHVLNLGKDPGMKYGQNSLFDNAFQRNPGGSNFRPSDTTPSSGQVAHNRPSAGRPMQARADVDSVFNSRKGFLTKEGTMTLRDKQGNEIGSWRFRNGGNGHAIPNGTYTVSNGRRRDPRRKPTMQVGGYGYSFDMSNKFDSRLGRMRTLLRIHPDGMSSGTIGCIGIKGGVQAQRDFYTKMQQLLRENGGTYQLHFG